MSDAAYTYTTPPITPKDLVRFWSQDYGTLGPLISISDQDIEFMLSPSVFNGKYWLVAALVCERIGDYYKSLGTSNQPKRVGPLTISNDGATKAQAWYDRAEKLKMGNPSGASGGPIFTGSGHPTFRVGLQDSNSPFYGDDRLGG